jgi:hypothetical protein
MLSQKQKEVIRLLEFDPTVTDVYFGGSAGCFSAETLVQTSTGSKQISQINIGDFAYCLLDGRIILKQIINVYAYGGNVHKHKMIIFTTEKNIIRCTYDHKFYFNGNWQPAYQLAGRVMGVGGEHIKQICNQHTRATDDNRTLWFKKTRNNETSSRRKRVFENRNNFKRKISNCKNTSFGGQSIYSKLTKEANSKPHQRNKNGQYIAELGMEHRTRKRTSCIQERVYKKTNLHKLCKGRRYWNVNTDRGKSKENKIEIYSKSLHQRNARPRIWSFSCNDKRHCATKELEARQIEISDIIKIEISNSSETVYDLTVQDAHNYIITDQNFIVHNSGKSVLGSIWQHGRRITMPESRGSIGRDTLINIKKTTLETFFSVWKKYFESNPLGVTMRMDGQKNTINYSNGSQIYLLGLEHNSSDPDAHFLGSLEITDSFIDEANGCSEKYVNILRSRIRHNLPNGKAAMLLTGNPGYDWTRNRFFKDKAGNPVLLKEHERVVRALLTDNPDLEFQETYRKQLLTLPAYDRDRLLYGDWDAVKSADNPFLHAFDETRHVAQIEYNPNLPIIVSIDFNINPFCALFGQVSGRSSWIYDEVAIQKGDLFKMADAIKARIPDNKKGLLKITGDKLGGNGQIALRDHFSNYKQLQQLIGLSESQFYLPANPTHESSRTDCNMALIQKDVKISNRCINLIADCKLVEVNNEGAIVKKNRDKMEQRSDFLDCFRYFINTFVK